MPKVLNKYTDEIPKGSIYIGRGSTWGNPLKIGENGTREEVIAQHEKWLANQPWLLARLPELHGKDLICFCSPRICHGDLLLKLANLNEEELNSWIEITKHK